MCLNLNNLGLYHARRLLPATHFLGSLLQPPRHANAILPNLGQQQISQQSNFPRRQIDRLPREGHHDKLEDALLRSTQRMNPDEGDANDSLVPNLERATQFMA